jgi:chloramphenicol-sensitive protein RarD
MPSPPRTPDALSPSGIGLATACYALWGLTPVYWKAVGHVPAEQALIPRVLWTLILLLVASLATRSLGQTWRADLRTWISTSVAALLLAINWTLFIHAVQNGQVLATSLGYYINPLMSILLGLIVLGERLNRAQGLAVAIAALGVAALTIQEGTLPWISLILAASFALYGLIHKLHPQATLGGLTREMLVLSPLALAALLWFASRGQTVLFDAGIADHGMLSLSGVVTAAPLLLFHAATRRLPLVAVGMFQYIAPTLTLALATLHYGEPFTPSHATAFGLVWLGLVVFTIDSARRAAASMRTRSGPASTPSKKITTVPGSTPG